MNIEKRLTALENEVKAQAGEGLVPIKARNTEEFERKRLEYLKSPPPKGDQEGYLKWQLNTE